MGCRDRSPAGARPESNVTCRHCMQAPRRQNRQYGAQHELVYVSTGSRVSVLLCFISTDAEGIGYRGFPQVTASVAG